MRASSATQKQHVKICGSHARREPCASLLSCRCFLFTWAFGVGVSSDPPMKCIPSCSITIYSTSILTINTGLHVSRFSMVSSTVSELRDDLTGISLQAPSWEALCIHNGICDCVPAQPSTSQRIDELDFMRSACQAAQAGDIAKLSRILARNPAAVHNDGTSGTSGYTPLHYAARAGRVQAVALLLKHGAKVDAQTREGKATSLHRAAATGQLAVAEMLVATGADGLLQDADGEAPLHKAAAMGHLQTCQFLIEKFPASQELTDKRGRTPAKRATGAAAAAFGSLNTS